MSEAEDTIKRAAIAMHHEAQRMAGGGVRIRSWSMATDEERDGFSQLARVALEAALDRTETV